MVQTPHYGSDYGPDCGPDYDQDSRPWSSLWAIDKTIQYLSSDLDNQIPSSQNPGEPGNMDLNRLEMSWLFSKLNTVIPSLSPFKLLSMN